MKPFLLIYLAIGLMTGHTYAFAEETTILVETPDIQPATITDETQRAEQILSGGENAQPENAVSPAASASALPDSDQTESFVSIDSDTITEPPQTTTVVPPLTESPTDTSPPSPALPESVLLNSEQDTDTPETQSQAEETPVTITVTEPTHPPQTIPLEWTTSPPLPATVAPFESKRTKKTERVYDYIVYEAQNPDWVATSPNPYTPDAPWLLVGARTQTMKQFDSWGRLEKQYPVSTAKRGVGEIENSYQTPRGHHKICERIGDNLPARTIFSRRQATEWRYSKELHEQYPKKDWILTRILWLCGQEEGKNKGYNTQGQVVDSYKRYIYIHGSGDHAPFGVSPSSLGCVRMISEDVIDVFNQTQLGTDVVIEENQ